MATRVYERIVQQDLNTGTGAVTVTNPGGGSLPGTQIGIHSFGIGQAATTATWAPGDITAGSYATTTATVSGAAVGDFVLVSHGGIATASPLILSARVEAANTVRVILFNPAATAATPASGTLKVLVLKSA